MKHAEPLLSSLLDAHINDDAFLDANRIHKDYQLMSQQRKLRGNRLDEK